MTVATTPPEILSRPVGGMILDPSTAETAIYVRVDKHMGASLPSMCRIESVLPIWDANPVLVCALLVRLARDARQTYECWLNVGDDDGLRAIKALGRKTDLVVHVVTDKIERSIRTPNTVYREAMQLYRETMRRDPRWTDQDFRDASRRVTRMYPSLIDLWRLGGAGRMHSV